MESFLPFVSLVFLSAGLGIDNGLLIEFALKSLNLKKRTHVIVRSMALILAALLRLLFLFVLAKLSFLENPLPDYGWLPNRWFSQQPQQLTWMSLVLFGGGIIIFIMAMWEFYHKIREELAGQAHDLLQAKKTSLLKLVTVVFYLAAMNILFSVDSVFAAVAIMDIKTQFSWIVAAILIASVIMVFGMIPISAIISRNRHFGVLMLSILAVIASKLMVDGTGEHFSNGLLIFIIAILLVNDAAQAAIDWADKRGNQLQRAAA